MLLLSVSFMFKLVILVKISGPWPGSWQSQKYCQGKCAVEGWRVEKAGTKQSQDKMALA